MEKRTQRTDAEWESIESKVEELKGLGFTVTKACEFIGVIPSTYITRQERKKELAARGNASSSVQLDGIAYGLEEVAKKLDALIGIGEKLLAVWEPKEPANNFGKAEKEKVERELGIRKFQDAHHL